MQMLKLKEHLKCKRHYYNLLPEILIFKIWTNLLNLSSPHILYFFIDTLRTDFTIPG